MFSNVEIDFQIGLVSCVVKRLEWTEVIRTRFWNLRSFDHRSASDEGRRPPKWYAFNSRFDYLTDSIAFDFWILLFGQGSKSSLIVFAMPEKWTSSVDSPECCCSSLEINRVVQRASSYIDHLKALLSVCNSAVSGSAFDLMTFRLNVLTSNPCIVSNAWPVTTNGLCAI